MKLLKIKLFVVGGIRRNSNNITQDVVVIGANSHVSGEASPICWAPAERQEVDDRRRIVAKKSKFRREQRRGTAGLPPVTWTWYKQEADAGAAEKSNGRRDRADLLGRSSSTRVEE